MVESLIGIGSNLGDPVQQCREALTALSIRPGVEVLAVSPFYRTSPVGKTDQPWFVNAVALIEVTLPPKALLAVLQEIEQAFGRTRDVRWGPRTLDLDILSYGDCVLELSQLSLPHPRMHERRFVLAPLADVAPRWLHPVFRRTASELLLQMPPEADEQIIECLER